MNPNYVIAVKQDLDKLLSARFIALVEEASWLLSIVILPKIYYKLQICMGFQGFNAITKKYPYLLPFTEEVLDKVPSHEVYSFLDGFFGYHQIMIALQDRYKLHPSLIGELIWVVMSFKLKNVPPTYQQAVNITFKE